jgi:hypothetical protein
MNPVTPPILSSENAYISLRMPFGDGFVPILNKILYQHPKVYKSLD